VGRQALKPSPRKVLPRQGRRRQQYWMHYDRSKKSKKRKKILDPVWAMWY
jgi:hypothetical protein